MICSLNLKKIFSKKAAAVLITAVVLAAMSFAASKKDDKKKDETEDTKTVITILNAMKSGNKKDPVTDDDVITFEGNVKISVEKGGTTTLIGADRVTYNRARDMLFAEGAVTLEQTDKNGTRQDVTSDTLLFNTATLDGVFDNARVIQADSNAINLPSGSTLNIASDIFARDDSGTIAFKTGELTFCNDENPHWKIKASKIWLLPGNEFAFLNALLYVGVVPVLYLPAFYYPKDELVFNPVFGYRNRSGYYFQTTTYLYGRKPLEKDEDFNSEKSSASEMLADYFSLVKPSKLMEQELQGLVLHNLDTEYKGDTTNHFKLMADWYANNGLAIGFDGVFKPKKIFNNLETMWMMGWSKTVFLNNTTNIYEPFDAKGNIYYDNSNFLGMVAPFRYKGKLNFSLSKPFTFNLSMPIYSDPFFDYDFGERTETMDWFSYLLNNPTQDTNTTTEAEKLSSKEISSFTWDTSLSYSVPLSEKIKPWLDTISISSMSANIIFSSLASSYYNPLTKTWINYESAGSNTKYGWYIYTPERKFFYPSSITPFKFSGRISGKIFGTEIDFKARKNKKLTESNLTLLDFSANKQDEEKSEENSESSSEGKPAAENSKENTSENKSSGDASSDNQTESEESGFELTEAILPLLDFQNETVTFPSILNYSLDYSITPSYTSQYSYASTPLHSADDFRWDRMKSSYMQFKGPVELSQLFGYKNNFASVSNSFLFDNLYQTHPYLSETEADGGYSESSRANLRKTDYSASYISIVNTNRFSLKPFVFYPHFKETGVSYNQTIKMMRTEFIGDAYNPQWDVLTVDWTEKESITNHNLETTLAATEFRDKVGQKFVYTATLPPQLEKNYFSFTAFIPHLSATVETGYSKESETSERWKKEPLKQSATLSFFNNDLKLSESFNYNLEDDYEDSFKASLSWKDLQAAYTMKYNMTYNFDPQKGWTETGKKEFVPYSFSFAYASSKKNFKYWKNRISFAPGLSTSIVADLLKPTSSYFIFSPSITFRINEFIDISFASNSRNDVIYRYFQRANGHPNRIPGEENLFKDLMNSFRFDDEVLRTSSGFKLQSLEFTVSHDLHDWDLKTQFKLEPRLVTRKGVKSYDFSPYFSLSVVWRPMDSIKTQIIDEYGTVKLNEN